MFINKTKSFSHFLFNSFHKTTFYQITVRKYSLQHEWIDLDYEEKIGRIGISNLGLKIIGPIAHAQIVPVGEYLQKNGAFARVIGRHYIAELVTPVKTEVIGFNKIWRDMPSFVTLDVEDENNWFVEINLSDQTQLTSVENLLTKEEYEKRYEQLIGDGIPRLLEDVQIDYKQ